MAYELAWGWEIAAAIFFGGLGGGAFILTAVTSFLTGNAYRDILKFGSYIGVLSAILCIFFFMLDLGAPERALFAYSNPSSMITIGTTILTVIIPLGLVYASFHLPDSLPRLKSMFIWSGNIRARTAIEVLAFIFGIGLVSYTGFVLGVILATPFWGSPLLAVLFFLSGVSTAIMAIGLLMTPLYTATKLERPKKALIEALHRLDVADGYMVVIELGALLAYVFTMLYSSEVLATRSAIILLSGSLSALFWGGVVVLGLLVPLLLLIFLAWRGRTAAYIRFYPPLLSIASISALVGGLLMRYTVVAAGQLAFFP
ncbi:MAG: polysulfide reductase NrfD [archaeon]|nr:polysulfide reductase NrfD [archaeon]